MRQLSLATVAVAAALAGCGTSGTPIQVQQWVGLDGFYYLDADPYIYEITGVPSYSELEPADFTLVTWPEMELVPSTAEELLVERYQPTHSIRLTPIDPLGARWYAIRWMGPPVSELTVLHGVPLSDGSMVWRFDSVYQPQLHQILYSEAEDPAGGVILNFRESVHLEACAATAPAMTITQGALTCSRSCGAGRLSLGEDVLIPCHLDPAEPFRVQVFEGMVAMGGGELVPAVDVMVTRALEVPRIRPVPPVPTALCAGVACE